MRVDKLQLARQGEQLALSDGEAILPITLTAEQQLLLLAETRGEPFSAFLLFHHDSRQINLLSFSNPHGFLKVLPC